MKQNSGNLNVLFKSGGICLALSGVFYLAGAVLSNIIGGSPIGNTYLLNLAAHLTASWWNFALFSLALLPMGIGVFALYNALKAINKKAMLVALILVGIFLVWDLAVTEFNSLKLVWLVQNSLPGTEGPLSLLPVGTFISYFESSVGFLIISIVMLKSTFGKLLAILGIVATIEGIIGSFYIFIPALGLFLTPCLVAFGIWLVLAGFKLYKLGKMRLASA
jgi:hypothetical protein